jgi:hypothetical protein
MPAPDFPVILCGLLAKQIRPLLKSLPPKPRVSGMPAGFTERDLRTHLSRLLRKRTRALPQTFSVERQLPKDNFRTYVDCAFTRKPGRIAAEDILATCELKGPVRKTFFDPRKFEGNFAQDLVKDTQKQLRRGTHYRHAQHFVALLAPHYELWTKHNPLADILAKIEARVRGATLALVARKRVLLPHGVPLDIIILRVTRKTATHAKSGHSRR